MKNIIVMFVFLLSCGESQQKESQLKTIAVDVERTQTSDLFLDSVATVKRVQLKRPSAEKYIGAVKKIALHGNELYVSDGKNIFVYGMDGECRFILDREGKANEEYLRITDFAVIDKNFYVTDYKSSKLISYTQNGEFIASHKFDFRPNSINLIHDGSLIIGADNGPIDKGDKMLFNLFDVNKWEIITAFYPDDVYKSKYLNILWDNKFTMVNDSLFYYEPHNNTIRHIDNGRESEYLKVDFGKNEPPLEFYQKEYEDVVQFMLTYNNTDYASGIYWAIWNDSKFMFQFLHQKKIKVALCDRKGNETQIYQSIKIDENRKMEEFYTDSNNLISYFSPEQDDEGDNDIMVLIATLKN